MGRWTQYDEDSYRLPEGMRRIGYDADTGQYIFADRGGGGTYRGESGSFYGPMTPAGASATPQGVADSETPEEVKAPTRLQRAMRRATLPSMPTTLQNLKKSISTTRRPWQRDPSSDDDNEVAAVQTAESKTAHTPSLIHATLVPSTVGPAPKPPSPTALHHESKATPPSAGGPEPLPIAALFRSATTSTSRRPQFDPAQTWRRPLFEPANTRRSVSESKSPSPPTPKPIVASSTPAQKTASPSTDVEKVPETDVAQPPETAPVETAPASRTPLLDLAHTWRAVSGRAEAVIRRNSRTRGAAPPAGTQLPETAGSNPPITDTAPTAPPVADSESAPPDETAAPSTDAAKLPETATAETTPASRTPLLDLAHTWRAVSGRAEAVIRRNSKTRGAASPASTQLPATTESKPPIADSTPPPVADSESAPPDETAAPSTDDAKPPETAPVETAPPSRTPLLDLAHTWRAVSGRAEAAIRRNSRTRGAAPPAGTQLPETGAESTPPITDSAPLTRPAPGAADVEPTSPEPTASPSTAVAQPSEPAPLSRSVSASATGRPLVDLAHTWRAVSSRAETLLRRDSKTPGAASAAGAQPPETTESKPPIADSAPSTKTAPPVADSDSAPPEQTAPPSTADVQPSQPPPLSRPASTSPAGKQARDLARKWRATAAHAIHRRHSSTPVLSSNDAGKPPETPASDPPPADSESEPSKTALPPTAEPAPTAAPPSSSAFTSAALRPLLDRARTWRATSAHAADGGEPSEARVSRSASTSAAQRPQFDPAHTWRRPLFDPARGRRASSEHTPATRDSPAVVIDARSKPKPASKSAPKPPTKSRSPAPSAAPSIPPAVPSKTTSLEAVAASATQDIPSSHSQRPRSVSPAPIPVDVSPATPQPSPPGPEPAADDTPASPPPVADDAEVAHPEEDLPPPLPEKPAATPAV